MTTTILAMATYLLFFGSSCGGSDGDGDGDFTGIRCGGLACEESCCLTEEDVAMTACQATCSSPYSITYSCDGPEDCLSGACCGPLLFGATCSQAAQCPDGQPTVCHGHGDCPSGECCYPVTIRGVAFSACAPGSC